MQADQRTHEAVVAVLNHMADAYRARDPEGLKAVLGSDADVFMFGTGADEKRVGWDQIRTQAERDWSQAESAQIRFSDIRVSSAGNVAWTSADATFEFTAGGQSTSMPARMTATLENRHGRWLLMQSHFSFAAAGQPEGASFPT